MNGVAHIVHKRGNYSEEKLRINLKVFTDNHIIKKKWPNSKFIILKYQTDPRMSFDWSAVEKIGIPVYDVNDYINLSEDKYSLPDKHPSALAWKEITPKFVKNTGM